MITEADEFYHTSVEHGPTLTVVPWQTKRVCARGAPDEMDPSNCTAQSTNLNWSHVRINKA